MKPKSGSVQLVSLTQPHIRPIVRGKSGSPTEFGAKLSVSCVEGYVFVEKISWKTIIDLLQKSFSSIDGTGSSAHPTRVIFSCGMGRRARPNYFCKRSNESGDFISQVEAYKEYRGVYPKSVHADKFIAPESIERACKKEEFDSAVRPYEYRLPKSAENLKNKHKKMSAFATKLREIWTGQKKILSDIKSVSIGIVNSSSLLTVDC